jgi:phage tail sheath protein FI
MTTYRRPGTYVEEVVLAQSIEAQGLESSVGAFVGAALRGPITAPAFVGSWTDFTRRFGGFRSADGATTYRLALAVYQFFANGGRGAYIQRVCGTGHNQATATFQDSAAQDVLTSKAIDPGDWAVGQLYVQVTDVIGTGAAGATVDNDVFSIVVYSGGTGAGFVVERWTDLTMNPADARYALDVVNGSSSWITLVRPTATGTKPPVSNTTPVALAKPVGITATLDGAAIGQTDLTGAADKFDTITSNLIFNIPDAYTLGDTISANVANAYILKAEARGDAFVVIDVPATSESTAAGAQTWGTTLNASANAAIYFPSIKILNPVSGAAGRLLTVAPGGAVVGLYHATDASRGVFKSPAGTQASLNNVVDVALRLTPAQLDSLNTGVKPLNAIKPVPGAGVCVMAARTLAGTRSNRYVAARRTLLSVKKAMTQATEFAVLENNDYRLWEQVRTVCSTYLNGLWQAGGLKGQTPDTAFYVKCDATNNTAQSVNDGVLNVEIGVALQTPAEFVVIRIGQFDGGTSVVEQNA